MRAFIAAELPTPALRQITAIQQKLAQQLRSQQLDRCVRWTSVNTIHLTLRFLGEIDDPQRVTLLQSLPAFAAHHSPFAVRVEGLSCFPNMKRPNVIWCGLQGEMRELERMQEGVELVVRNTGITPERKRFTPHLTIGRAQQRATEIQLRTVGAVVAQLAALHNPMQMGEPTQINELILFQSELTPSGPIYTRLGVFPLVGG